MKAIKLLTNGMPFIVDMPKRDYLYQSMQEVIGCDMVDIGACGLQEMKKYCLVYDEEFLLQHTPIINPVASYFFGLQNHGTPLCGTVLIMKNIETDDGINTVGLDEDDISYIFDVIFETLKDAVKASEDFLESLKK